MLTMGPLRLVRPRDLREALDALAGGAGVPLGGGTDLVPHMKSGLGEQRVLVSLRRLPELAGTRMDHEGSLVLGAGETLAQIAADPRIAREWPAVAAAAASVASPQIRNVATLGGNLCLGTRCTYYDQSRFWRQALGHCLRTCGDVCHVVPHGRRCVAVISADMPPALIACGASVRLASSRGERTLPLESFYTADGARNTVRRDDEIVVAVSVPGPEAGARDAIAKVRPRAAIDFPALALAARVALDGSGVVRSIRVVVGALASKPRVIDGLEDIAVGRRLDAGVIDAVAERTRAACHPLPTTHVDADWRRAVLPVHVRRLLSGFASPRLHLL